MFYRASLHLHGTKAKMCYVLSWQYAEKLVRLKHLYKQKEISCEFGVPAFIYLFI